MTQTASSVNSSTYRTLAWIGVALQAIALAAVLVLARWNGALSLSIFLILSVLFLWAEEIIPALISFLVVLGALVNAFGWAFNWFQAIAVYDEFVHFFAPFAFMSAIGYYAWRQGWTSSEPGSGGFILYVTLLGFGLGLVWEAIEMIFLNLSWGDTLVDLLMDTLGSAVAGWFIGWVVHRQRQAGNLTA